MNNNPNFSTTVKAACVKQVIEIQAACGSGTEGDPFRIVLQYWSPDGELLAENDMLRTGVFPAHLNQR